MFLTGYFRAAWPRALRLCCATVRCAALRWGAEVRGEEGVAQRALVEQESSAGRYARTVQYSARCMQLLLLQLPRYGGRCASRVVIQFTAAVLFNSNATI